MPRLFSLNPPLEGDHAPEPSAGPPAAVEAPAGKTGDPGRDALGRFLKDRHMGCPKAEAPLGSRFWPARAKNGSADG